MAVGGIEVDSFFGLVGLGGASAGNGGRSGLGKFSGTKGSRAQGYQEALRTRAMQVLTAWNGQNSAVSMSTTRGSV